MAEEKKTSSVRVAMMIAALGAMFWGFQTLILHHAPNVFTTPEEDMSFGWYVPLFSLYVLWTERRKLAEAAAAPSSGWGGFALMLPCLAMGFLGARGLQVRFEIAAFAGLLVAVPWAIFGRGMAKKVLFPAMFLLFCIPLATFLDVVTVHLRLLASSTAYEILRGFGADVIQRGTMIGALDGSFEIDVAEPCSGLRSIFALMALTAGYAYFNQPTWLRRALLFAASIPLAILGNVARILSICVVANCCSADFATGFYHDYSGYIVFIVAILLMLAAGELITKIAGRARQGGALPNEEQRAGRAATLPNGSASLLAPALALALLLPMMVYQAMTPAVTVTEPLDVKLGEWPGFQWREMEPSEAELKILPADTVIRKRLYTAKNGDWFQVTLVIGGTSKSSIHRPELCLPAQGNLMTDPRTVNVNGDDWRFITVRSPAATIGFAYSFFNQEKFRTASHTRRIFRDTWDRSVLNRIDRWIMVTVSSSRSDDAALSAIAKHLTIDNLLNPE